MTKRQELSNILDGTQLVGFGKAKRDKGSAKTGTGQPKRVVTAKVGKPNGDGGGIEPFNPTK